MHQYKILLGFHTVYVFNGLLLPIQMRQLRNPSNGDMQNSIDHRYLLVPKPLEIYNNI